MATPTNVQKTKVYTITGKFGLSQLPKSWAINLRIAATLIALPIGLLSLLPKPVFAAETSSLLIANRVPIVVGQQYEPRPSRKHDREEARREAIQYEEARRGAQRKSWLSGMGEREHDIRFVS